MSRRGWSILHTTVRADQADWIKKDFAPADSALILDWREKMGAYDDLDYLKQHDMVVVPDYAPMGPVTNDIEQINARIGDVVKTISWKMVFAKDEAEFNALKAEMIEKAEGMEVEKSNQWFIGNYNAVLEKGSKYSK